MLATDEDIRAARMLLDDDGAIHENCLGLTGADKCVHRLAGSGDLLDVVRERFGLFRVDGRYMATPYRHHSFDASKTGLCKCGNTLGNKVHTACWRQ